MSAVTRTISLEEIHKRDNGICHLCKTLVPIEEATRDHIIPYSTIKKASLKIIVSPNKASNLALAHQWCNLQRRDRPLEEGDWFTCSNCGLTQFGFPKQKKSRQRKIMSAPFFLCVNCRTVRTYKEN